MKKRLLSVLICAAMAATLLSACGKKEPDAGKETSTQETNADTKSNAGDETKSDDISVTFVPKLSGNAFFESANVGAQEYAKKVGGYTVKYDGNPEASVANQVAIINNAISQGSNGVCVSSVDATGLDAAMTRIHGR